VCSQSTHFAGEAQGREMRVDVAVQGRCDEDMQVPYSGTPSRSHVVEGGREWGRAPCAKRLTPSLLRRTCGLRTVVAPFS